MDSAAVLLVATEFLERSPALSADGRWLAYASDASGRSEIYVRPFPDVGSGLVAVEVATEQSVFVAGRQEVLFSLVGYLNGSGWEIEMKGTDSLQGP